MKYEIPNSSFACYILSGVLILFGLYKMFIYSTSSYTPINAYVGGDAYNFIINANLATAYFVLAIFVLIVGFIFQLNQLLTDTILVDYSESSSQNADSPINDEQKDKLPALSETR